MLNIVKEKNGTQLIVKLDGSLDSDDVFEQEMHDLKGITHVTLDMEKVNYVSSAGLRQILTTVKTMDGQGEVEIRNMTESIREIFNLTGFSEIVSY